jgi:hypothetical protein
LVGCEPVAEAYADPANTLDSTNTGAFTPCITVRPNMTYKQFITEFTPELS